jgi:hypothetical protein
MNLCKRCGKRPAKQKWCPKCRVAVDRERNLRINRNKRKTEVGREAERQRRRTSYERGGKTAEPRAFYDKEDYGVIRLARQSAIAHYLV